MESITKKFTRTHTYHHSCNLRHPYATRNVSTRSQCRVMQGFFERLPAEVLDVILEFLSMVDISVFSMVSKSINSYIMGYVSTQAWRNRMILPKFNHSDSSIQEHCILEHYQSLGVLFKRCTLLLPTKERLKFIFSKFSQVPCFTMERCTSSTGCPGFASYRVFLQTLIAGWDELECQRVFNFLCEFTNLPRKIETVVKGKPGVSHSLELEIRLFCRTVLLDSWKSQWDTRFWLTRILKLWPTISEARLLFIFYGPLLPDGKIGWHKMLDGLVMQCELWDLASAVILLFTDLENWCAGTLLGIIGEMTVLPDAWHMENMARLLVLCGNSICYSVLACKAVNRHFFETSRLMVFIILVCEKDGFCMNWPVKMMRDICKVFPTSEDKWSFIQGVERRLSEVTMEMYEVIMAGMGSSRTSVLFCPIHLALYLKCMTHFPSHHQTLNTPVEKGDRNERMETFQSFCSLLIASFHFHTKMVFAFLRMD